MRYLAAVLVFLPALVVIACSDAARGAFDTAAEQDQASRQVEAVELYIKAHDSSPDTHFGQLSQARAQVLLLELGAQQIQAEQWDALDTTASKLLALDAASVAASIYKGYAAYGKGQYTEATELLKKASGEPVGVAPPSDLAVEATAQALYRGAEAGARSTLGGSIVDAQFLKTQRSRLTKRVAREKTAAERRAKLSKDGTIDAWATLIHNYPDSAEAKAVRPPYAEKLAAKLAGPTKVGPPTTEDPDPISTVADALKARAPDEPAAKTALANVDKLRKAWERRYEDEIKAIDEQMGAVRDGAMQKIAKVIGDKCVPLKAKAAKGVKGAVEELQAARDEAAKLIPHGMTEAELNEVSLLIIANCSPPAAQ